MSYFPREPLFVVIFVCTYFGLKRLFGNWKAQCDSTPNNRFLIGAIALALGLYSSSYKWGSKTPGGFLERNRYEGNYIAYLFREHQLENPLMVQANISAIISSDETYDIDGPRSSSWREYRIRKIILPNGGVIPFSNSEMWGDYLEYGRTNTVRDDHDRYWRIALTNLRVSE